jgi:hypothetical protein
MGTSTDNTSKSKKRSKTTATAMATASTPHTAHKAANTAHCFAPDEQRTNNAASTADSTASASDTDGEEQPRLKRTRFAEHTTHGTDLDDDEPGHEMTAEPTPGTLRHKAWEAAQRNELTDPSAANHILHWVEIMSAGASTIARALDHERRCAQPRPVAFAMVSKLHG